MVEEFGGLDILVNNAGVARDNLLFKMTEDDWDTVMNVHLRGTFLVTRAAQRIMVERRYGRVINLSSTAAIGNRARPTTRRRRLACKASPKRLHWSPGRSASPSARSRPVVSTRP
jgi:NAD(P)-dependent dehydrogenase (short-subunit alcohol dehydrogenase family)